MTVCCEHNRCPDKPRIRLWRRQSQPWRCPQCERWWVTKQKYSWGECDGWTWVEVSAP